MVSAAWPTYLRCPQLRLQLLLLLLFVCVQLLQPCLCDAYLVASSVAQLTQALDLNACPHARTFKGTVVGSV